MSEFILWLLWDTYRARKQCPAAIARRQRARLTEMVAFARANSPYSADSTKTSSDRVEAPTMLQQALGKYKSPVAFSVLDGQILAFPNSCFDDVLLNLILSVVPDGAIAMQESWRVLKPGGRIAIFDKFLSDQGQPSIFRRFLGGVIRWLGTDPNRRLSDMLKEIPDAVISNDEPALLRGQYRVILMNKPV